MPFLNWKWLASLFLKPSLDPKFENWQSLIWQSFRKKKKKKKKTQQNKKKKTHLVEVPRIALKL